MNIRIDKTLEVPDGKTCGAGDKTLCRFVRFNRRERTNECLLFGVTLEQSGKWAMKCEGCKDAKWLRQ